MKIKGWLFSGSMGPVVLVLALMVALLPLPRSTVRSTATATQVDIVGPPGSGAFGASVTALPSGNIVVTDPYYDDGLTADVGAVYLYDGATGALISTLTGSSAGDRVGSHGVAVLSSGNYLVFSLDWHAAAGAVTWGSGTSGSSGVVSAANSLVGSTAGDGVGSRGAAILTNGNYVVVSPFWDNGAAADAGAVTWGNGTTGTSGVVSAANSLVGTTTGDQVGTLPLQAEDDQVGLWWRGVAALSNGNYVVSSPVWDNGAAVDAGAVTWGSGTTGASGVVSAANSLVGSAAADQVGSGYYLPHLEALSALGNGSYGITIPPHINLDGVMPLSNGNYVVLSPFWHGDAGAATWGSGTTGIRGVVSAENSLVGSAAGDEVGGFVTALSNSNYVVTSPYWDNGVVVDAGAATWGSGTEGIKGVVSAANSLVGSTASDRVGGLAVLSNGNYVVTSPVWDNGLATDAGAVTWGNGTTGISGTVSVANSLVGSTGGDQVGHFLEVLSNSNYVVYSDRWDNGMATDAGAVTWGNGATGIRGVVSAANSLVGNTASDQVGIFVTALSNGNYAVTSPFWHGGAGAATWGNGTTGTSGVVSAANSLVGSIPGDEIGTFVIALTNGNYVVISPYWDSGPAIDLGAVTWGSGTTGISGMVSATNSLVGSTAGDQVGSRGVAVLSNGNYVVRSDQWDNGALVDAGAVTWGNGTAGTSGVVSAANSLVGSTAGDQVGWVEPLSNGNYVVRSDQWDNGALVDAGAVTWGNGTTGTSGVVSAANSLVGSTASDQVGWVEPLSNGNYVVRSEQWDNGALVDAGAVTWGNGTTGVSGVVSAANSLVGSTAGDQVGWVEPLGNGDYVVRSDQWDNGASVDAGAVTWGSRLTGVAGPIATENSVCGTTAAQGSSIGWAYDYANRQLVVGRPADSIVTLFRLPPIPPVFLPVVLKNGPRTNFPHAASQADG